MATLTEYGNSQARDQMHTSAATQAAAVGFLTQCTTAGTPSVHFFFPVFSRPHPRHMEVPRLGGLIGAVTAGHSCSRSNAGSEPRLLPTPQLMAMPDP